MRVKHFAKKVFKKFAGSGRIKRVLEIRETTSTHIYTIHIALPNRPIRRECLASTTIPDPVGILRDMFAT